MTDREPDDLYDALRNRLADYGQEPPAPLWANIRAQLPPPVAAPQLRRRARRRWLAVLALLLLVGAGTWQWGWPGGPRTTRTDRLATQATSPHADPAARQPGASPSAAGPAAEPAVPGPTPRRTAADAVAHSAATANEPAEGPLHPPAAPATGGAFRPARSRPAVAATVATSRPQAAAASGLAPTTRAAASAKAGATSGAVAARTTRPDMQKIVPGTSKTGPVARASNARPVAVDRPGPTARASSAVAAQFSARAEKAAARRINHANQAAATRAVSKHPVSAEGENLPTTALAENTPALPRAAVTTGATATTATGSTTSSATPSPAAQTAREAWQPAERRTPIVLRQSSLRPTLLARADTLPPLPVAAVRRWAVQALAGPALTGQLLSSGRLAYAPAPTSTYSPINNGPRRVVSTSAAQGEEAATGFGAEGLLQRQLTGRWSLGTGLGYRVFATSQTVNVRVAYSPSIAGSAPLPDSVGTMSVRNTYQFLILPLRASYQLGAGSSRLRFGLRAGADLAIYLGGRSIEAGSASSSNWGTSGSPYAPLSLALSLGAEARYQLAPGWELLAQPTFTHFATSLARPTSAVARYPLAATALVGVAWWLR